MEVEAVVVLLLQGLAVLAQRVKVTMAVVVAHIRVLMLLAVVVVLVQ